MWEVSDRFLAAIREPGIRFVSTVDVLDAGEVVQAGVPILSGSITCDRTALNLRQLTCVVGSPDLAPRTATDVLGPAGYEVQVNCGIQFYDGTVEMVPCGIFGIQSAKVSGNDLTTAITAVDRSRKVSDALLEAPVHFAPGHNPATAAVTLIQTAIPDVLYDVASVPVESGGRVVYAVDSNPWAIVNDIFKMNGGWAYFDGAGVFVAQLEPDVRTGDPVWTVDDGPGGVLLADQPVDLVWSREPAFNKTRVVGENTEFNTTYVGTAKDTAAESPSNYNGRFGHKPMATVHSAHVTSTASAQAAARALLVAKQGVAMSIDFSSVPNRALECADIIQIKQTSLGLDLAVVLDQVTIDLGPSGAMTGTVRARQENDVEVE